MITYLDRLLKSDRVFLAKADSSPFEHLCLLSKVWDGESLVLGQQGPILTADQIIDLVEQVLASLHPCVPF